MPILKSNYSYVQAKILYKLCNPITGYIFQSHSCFTPHTSQSIKILKNTINDSSWECGKLNNHSVGNEVMLL